MIQTELEIELSAEVAEYKLRMCELTWIVRAVLPTPPSPRTTSLYMVILPAIPILTTADLKVR